MQRDIELEVLRNFDRPALEGLQMHARYLRDLVNLHARTLALRSIHLVEIQHGGVTIQLLEDDDDVIQEVIHVVAPDDRDLEMLFRRVNNAFVHRLTVSFRREDLLLPYYLRANASELQCRISVLHVESSAEEEKDDGTPTGVDFALVDFLGVHLKPQTYETSPGFNVRELREDSAMLFTHDALRGHVKHLDFELEGATDAPDCIIPELLGVDVVETCTVTTAIDPRPWIRKFADMFEMSEPGTATIRSVTLLLNRPLYEVKPLSHTVNPLGQPLRTDAPTPHSAFTEEWSRTRRLFFGKIITESPTAELFVFENAKAAKKLEVYMWTIEQEFGDVDDLTVLEGLHYAFMLQVVDM